MRVLIIEDDPVLADGLTRSLRHADGDCLLFGGESQGLPAEMIARFTALGRALTIPIPSGKVRSLNLATATGIALYEALRQLHRW